MIVADRGGPIHNNVYAYSFGELFSLDRNAIDPEMQDFVKALRDRQNKP